MKINRIIVQPSLLLLLVVFAVVLQSCRTKTRNYHPIEQDTFPEMEYELNFRGVQMVNTKGGFNVPESVTVDGHDNYIYVSNINGMPDEKNGSGYVTRVMFSGDIIDTLKLNGLNAPKGMVVANNYLYIADIDRVIVYNVEKQELINILVPEGAEFLNDITADADDNVYVSDSKAGKVFRISQLNISTFVCDSLSAGVNGLCVADAYIAMGAANRIVLINPMNARTKIFANLSFTPDGLKRHNDTTFLASDFVGNIYSVTPKNCRLLVSARENVNAADFEYIPEQNILIVPTFFNNTIDIYHIGLD